MADHTKNNAEQTEERRDTRPYAVAKYIRISPYKVRAVLDLIRGKSVAEAQAILAHSPNGGAAPTLKTLNSAIANAEHNRGMDRGDLYVAACFADGGTSLKRMQPVSKGRGHAILKRTSHITVILDVKKAEGEL